MKSLKRIVNFENLEHVDRLCTYMEDLKDGIYWVEIKKYRKNRSLEQNGYYWGVVIEILSREFGCIPEEMHEILKARFNSEITILPNGEEVRHVKSTKDKDTFNFEEYLEDIRVWADTEFGINIPLPNEEFSI